MLPLKDAASFVELDSFTYSKLGKSSQKRLPGITGPPQEIAKASFQKAKTTNAQS